MTMRVTFRPLRWSGPETPADQRYSRRIFKAGWSSTLQLLDDELWHLSARDVVAELDVDESRIRRDGWPRENATAGFPGVRVAFASKHGPLTYATDAYDWWQHNVRAIALSLQALRAVDRYGVTTRGEQYTGWAALPSAPTAEAFRAAAEVVARIAHASGDGDLAVLVESVTASPEARRAAVAVAKRKAHPDLNAGSRNAWDELTWAAKTLGVPL